MTSVFISYRRDDASGATGRLYDALLHDVRLPPDAVFMDVDGIKPGIDFLTAIERVLDRADVVLAVIGPEWLTARDGRGGRRLDDPADYVRLEVARALERAEADPSVRVL